MKTKLLFIGSSGANSTSSSIGGQVTKNYTLFTYLKKEQFCVRHIDTFDWRRNFFSTLFGVLHEVVFGGYSHILTSLAGMSAVRTLKLLTILKRSLNFKLYHMVVGGNIIDRINVVPSFLKTLLRCDGVFVESETIAKNMRALGLSNTLYAPNFRNYSFTPSAKPKGSRIGIVFFSRVCREKGIELAIEALNGLDKYYDIELDIYGPIQTNYKDRFINLVTGSSNVNYKGVLEPGSRKTYEILSSYGLMIFPTFHEGEGFPGAIIDGYISGLPVIASDWKYNSEIINEGRTGWLIQAKDSNALRVAIEKAVDNRELLEIMRSNCIEEAKKYHTANVIPSILAKMLIDS